MNVELTDDSVVVVIGSGAGGATIAHDLCARGVKVVLLEAGPRIELSEFRNDEFFAYQQLTWADIDAGRPVTGWLRKTRRMRRPGSRKRSAGRPCPGMG
jgi:choline dehydrogenase-like flavoprotein